MLKFRKAINGENALQARGDRQRAGRPDQAEGAGQQVFELLCSIDERSDFP